MVAQVSFTIDKVQAAGLGRKFCMVSLKNPHPAPNTVDEIGLIAATCGVHRYRVVQALPLITELNLPFVTKADIGDAAEEDDDADGDGAEEQAKDIKKQLLLQGLKKPQELRIRIGDHEHDMCFGQLSTREQSIAVISIGIAIAFLESQHAPTLFSVELDDNWLPDPLLNQYANLLTEDRFSFQSIFVSQSEYPKIDWNGWSIARLKSKPPEVVIEQTLISQ